MKSLRKVLDNEEGLGNNKLFVSGTNSENDADGKRFATLYHNESMISIALKNNPEQGFEMLFRKYYKPLCSHAVRFLYSKELAEDVVSDVFAHLWGKKHYANVTTSYRSYLYQSVRNTCLNYLKSEFGKKGSNSLSMEEDSNEKFIETDTPQEILLLDELYKKIEESVASFPPQCQKVFLLSRFEGKKNKEIAEELNIKLKTVEAHIMKALRTLKNCLASYLN